MRVKCVPALSCDNWEHRKWSCVGACPYLWLAMNVLDLWTASPVRLPRAPNGDKCPGNWPWQSKSNMFEGCTCEAVGLYCPVVIVLRTRVSSRFVCLQTSMGHHTTQEETKHAGAKLWQRLSELTLPVLNCLMRAKCMLLTLNMLNCFKDHKRYIHILGHILDLV